MEIGDRVYLKAINERARYKTEVDIEEYIICKIGRKYFEVCKEDYKNYTIQFEINNKRQVTKYSPDWQLYFSKQEILDEEEHLNLSNQVRDKIGSYGTSSLSLDKLRKIKEIIDDKS